MISKTSLSKSFSSLNQSVNLSFLIILFFWTSIETKIAHRRAPSPLTVCTGRRPRRQWASRPCSSAVPQFDCGRCCACTGCLPWRRTDRLAPVPHHRWAGAEGRRCWRHPVESFAGCVHWTGHSGHLVVLKQRKCSSNERHSHPTGEWHCPSARASLGSRLAGCRAFWLADKTDNSTEEFF